MINPGDGSPCFAVGTHIATPAGVISVEDLEVGATVLTAKGEARPVRRLGEHRVDCAKGNDPTARWPICIRVNAFADGQPSRDLWVSPGHGIQFDDFLVPVEKLINGATVFQVPTDQVHYWQVELDSHDVLMAENLPAESYPESADKCLPLALEGEPVTRAKSSLLARAELLGFHLSAEAQAHILADGQRIEPVCFSDTRMAFMLPANCASITLQSRRFVPAQVEPTSQDQRVLGLCIKRLQLDGIEIPLDAAVFSDGCHGQEASADGEAWRWTRQGVVLPPGTRLVLIELNGFGRYWNYDAVVAVTAEIPSTG